VWRALGEMERYVEWGSWVHAVRRVDRPAGLGAAYDERSRLLLPIATPSRWRIVEFDAPRRQVHRAESAALAAAFDRVFELSADGGDGTWLTLMLRYRPALGPLGRAVDRAGLRALQARRLPAVLERIDHQARRPPGPTAVP
jgi:hypothetical protein